MKKIKITYCFSNKRDYKIVTPCCGKSNRDGKFVNYKDLPNIYGFCHSCGEDSKPKSIHEDDKGNQFTWNDVFRKYEPLNSFSLPKIVVNNSENQQEKPLIKYIPEFKIWEDYKRTPENNLINYLRRTYGVERANLAKELYALGTSKRGQTVFWSINKNLKVQKAKYMFYDENGRRYGNTYQPYQKDQGYYSCLFGEHLISDSDNSTIVLVESEKTAIVGFISLPKYTWLAYGGATLLNIDKAKPLIGHKVVVIPDIEEKAVNIMKKKQSEMKRFGVDFNIWDMTEGKPDKQLEKEGIYKNDLEDFLRKIPYKIIPN